MKTCRLGSVNRHQTTFSNLDSVLVPRGDDINSTLVGWIAPTDGNQNGTIGEKGNDLDRWLKIGRGTRAGDLDVIHGRQSVVFINYDSFMVRIRSRNVSSAWALCLSYCETRLVSQAHWARASDHQILRLSRSYSPGQAKISTRWRCSKIPLWFLKETTKSRASVRWVTFWDHVCVWRQLECNERGYQRQVGVCRDRGNGWRCLLRAPGIGSAACQVPSFRLAATPRSPTSAARRGNAGPPTKPRLSRTQECAGPCCYAHRAPTNLWSVALKRCPPMTPGYLYIN